MLAQVILEGSWKGQNQPISCWASSLSNLTQCRYNKTVPLMLEDVFFNKFKADISSDKINSIFIPIADSVFNFRNIRYDSVLNFTAFQKSFSYKFSRPVIYSFGFGDSPNGHFVNVYGTLIADTPDNSHNRWLNIFDPKPKIIGNYYLKNYKTYQIINPSQYPLQGTYYQVVAKRFPLPLEILNARQKAINSTGVPLKECIPKNGIRKSIDAIIRSSAFIDIIGTDISYVKDSIPMKELKYNLIKKESITETQFITIESKQSSFLIIPLSKGHLKGGVVIDMIKNDCFLIDRIENLGYLSAIESKLTNKKGLNIFIIEHGYRFLYFLNEVNKSSIIDMDGYFGSPLEKEIPIEEFFQKLLKIDSKLKVKVEQQLFVIGKQE